MAPKDCTSSSVEVSYSQYRPLMSGIDEIVCEQLVRCGLLKSVENVLVKKRFYIKHAYPISGHFRFFTLKVIMSFLSKYNIISTGRFGGWEYLSMEDALIEGQRVANLIFDISNKKI